MTFPRVRRRGTPGKLVHSVQAVSWLRTPLPHLADVIESLRHVDGAPGRGAKSDNP